MRHFIILLLSVCPLISFSQDDVFRRIQTQAIEAKDGDTIYLPEGKFSFNRSLSIDGKNNIVVVGKGMDKTVLSFKNQLEGAEGLKINQCKNIRIQDFTIQDAKGDCIKAFSCEDIVFSRVKTEWTGKPSEKNGGYGLYPVSCTRIVLDECHAIGASDAGIYVGQSYDVIVKNCFAKNNVAGIEIENCVNAEVYNNLATENTGGILVFDMPELPLKRGRNVTVYNNKIVSNNYRNFAPKGNIVGEVPSGTGVMVMASENVEIRNNHIENHRTASVSIISYYISERKYNDAEYNPFPYKIRVLNNSIQQATKGPSKQSRIGLLLWLKFGKKVPAILYDGIIDDKVNAGGPAGNTNIICVDGNTNETFANLDAGNNFKALSKDITPFRCK